MVSERYESMARESRWSSYCVFDAMAYDAIPQKNESLKKEVVDIQSIAANIKQQLRDHMAKLDQQFKEMIEEIRIIRFRSGSYIENSMKPEDSLQMEIESGGFTSNGEEAVRTPDLSQEEVFDFNGEMKPDPDFSVVTMMIGEEEGKENKEEGEKMLLIEENKEVTMKQGSPDNTVHIGDDKSLKTYLEDSYEYEELGFRLGPEPDPPDWEFLPPQVGKSVESSAILSSTVRGVGIQTISSIHVSSNIRVEAVDGQVQPNLFMGRETAQGRPSSFESKYRLILGSPSNHDDSNDVSTTVGQQMSTQNSLNSINTSKKGSMRNIAECKDSRAWKTEVTQRELDRLSPQTIESMLKQLSQPPTVQVSTNLLGKNVRTQLSPLSDKTNDAINQSLNTTNFGIRPNLDRKLSLNSNSKQDLKLPDQLLQSFHKPNFLLSSSLLSGNNAELFTSRFSPPCSLSSQLIQNQENVPKKREKPAVYLVENYRLLDIPEFLILVGDYIYRMDYERIIKVHGETNVDIIVAAMPMDEKRVIAFGPLKINVYSKEGDDQYVMEVLKCLFEYTIALDLLEDHGALMYHLTRTDMGMNMVIGTKVYMGIDPISSPFRVKLWSIVGELNPLSREIDIHQKGSKLFVGTMVVKDNGIGWVTDTKRNTDPRVHILIQESIQVEEGKKLNKVSKVITRLIGLIFVRCCHKVMKYFMWKCSNGWPGLMEFVGMVVKVKLAAVLFGDKTAQDEEVIMLGCSIDYSLNGTKLLEWFPVAGLCLRVENTHILGYVVENMSGRLAGILVTLTVALKRKCDIMTRHSRIGNDIMWSFYEGEMEHEWKDWILVAAGSGEVATGQQRFLYFFYPP